MEGNSFGYAEKKENSNASLTSTPSPHNSILTPISLDTLNDISRSSNGGGASDSEESRNANIAASTMTSTQSESLIAIESESQIPIQLQIPPSTTSITNSQLSNNVDFFDLFSTGRTQVQQSVRIIWNYFAIFGNVFSSCLYTRN